MKNKKGKTKSFISKLLSMAIIMSACAVPFGTAQAEQNHLALNLDFESGVTANMELTNGTGTGIVAVEDATKGNALKIPSRASGLATHANLYAKPNNSGASDAKDYILSFDFLATQQNVGYVMQGQNVKENGSGTSAYFCFVLNYDGNVGFGKGGGWITPAASPAYHYTSYEANKWYSVDIVVDIDEKKLEYYIDGEKIGEDVGSSNFGTGAFKFAGILARDTWVNGVADPETQALFIDNFNLRYTDETSFSVNTKTNGNTLNLEFTETPLGDMSELEIKDCKTGESLNVENIDVVGKIVSITFDSLTEGKEYVLIMPEGISSVAGNVLGEEYVYFTAGETVYPSVKTARMTDIYGKSYGPLQKMPITQAKLSILFNGMDPLTEEEVKTAVTLADVDGNLVPVSNPEVLVDEITFDIDEFLSMSGEYTVKVTNLAGMNYEAKFITNDDTTEGFFEIELVDENGNKISSVSEGEVFVKTKFVNTTKEDFSARITVAAFEETDGVLNMAASDVKDVKIPSMSLINVGVNENDEKIGFTVLSGAKVLKAFLWTENNAPIMDSFKVGDYSQNYTDGEDGVIQNGEIVSVVMSGFDADEKASFRVFKDSADFYKDQVNVSSNGKASIEFALDASSGDYYGEFVTEENIKKTLMFTYVNLEEFSGEDGVATKIDEAIREENKLLLENALREGYSALGISEEIFESADSGVASDVLYNKLIDEDIIISDISWNEASEIAKKAFIIGLISKGSLDNVFLYVDELELEEDESYEWYTKDFISENVQKELTKRLTGEYETEAEFYGAFFESFVLSVVNYSDGVSNTKAILKEFAEEIGIEKNAKSSTYKELDGTYFDSFEALKAEFWRLEKKSESSSSGSSSGGGGGKKTSGTAKSEFIITTTETAEDKTILFNIFSDLSGFDWAEQAIVYLAERKIVNGKSDEIFAPKDFVTREEFAAMLVRAFVTMEDVTDVTFKDAVPGAWYNEYLKKAVSAGIVTGYDDGRFGIGEKITRQDMVTMLGRAANYAGTILENADDEPRFNDDTEIADYAKEAVYLMKRAEIVAGFDGENFAPSEYANRAQAAKVIFGLLNI